MSFKITVLDEETGETGEKRITEGDYFLLTTGSCHLASRQVYPKSGTVQLTIKGHNPKGAENDG